MKYLLLFFFLISTQIEAQTFDYFNKTFWHPDTLNILSMVAQPIEDGYLVMGGYNSLSGRTMYIRKIDKKGNSVWIKTLDKGEDIGIIEDGKRVIKTKDGNFTITYVKLKPNGFAEVNLVKFTPEGEVLWRKNYPDTFDNKRIARQLIQTYDDGFMMAGADQYDGEIATYYILKTDEFGNFEWDKTYQLDDGSLAYSIQQTPDWGYIIGGRAWRNGWNYQMYVVRTDYQGNVLWEKDFGGFEEECAGIVTVLTDLDDFVQTGKIEYLLSGCLRESGVKKQYFARLDDEGNIIWERKHQYNSQTFPYPQLFSLEVMPVLKEDGGFIGISGYEWRIVGGTLTYQPLIIDYDAEANINWFKEISIDTTAHVYLKDIQPTDDGGYVLAGYQFSPSPQKSWVLKIDSLGNTCMSVGCDSTVLITNIEDVPISSNAISLSIFPNPASEQVEVVYQLPIQQEGILWMYDYQGRNIGDWRLGAGSGDLILEVGDWRNGVYFYSLEVEGERIYNEKLVIEN